MSWAFRVAHVRGIDIKVHITFFLILILGGLQWADSVPDSPLEGMLFGVVLMLLLFVCVTLHELGHSIVAQGYGIPVKEIILLPLGGVALISKQPERPLHELVIAAAGPLVNAIIAALLFGVIASTGTTLASLSDLGRLLNAPSLQTLLLWLLAANVSLFVFNLIPAFPLDGGRILVSLLPNRLAYQYSRLEPYGMVILILLIVSGALWWMIGPVMGALLKNLYALLGF